MNYEEALEYIHGTLKFGVKLGLKNITVLLDLMGNPHKNLNFVHIAGTNGKGSTAAFISSILKEAGYRVGTFTSPYLERFTERIKVDDSEISESDVARITEFVRGKVNAMIELGYNHPTEFEIVTALGMQYFYEKKCDVVVLEVGLGGRFDSTNVIDSSLVSVITAIGYDHMNILGNTLSEIAFEKAGIIKPSGEVVMYPQPREAEEVIEDVCAQRGATLHKVDFDSAKIVNWSVDGQVFHYDKLRNLKIALIGRHQVRNAVMAVEACRIISQKGYTISEDAVRRGLEKARWPGRMEILKKEPIFMIDGAHNAQGAGILKEALDEYFPDRRRIFIFGVLRDKDYMSMIKTVIPGADTVIAVTPDSDRALPASDLAILLEPYCKNIHVSDTIVSAVMKAFRLSSKNDVICAFGSLYYIGKIRSMLREEPLEYNFEEGLND